MNIRIKRIYEPSEKGDGKRILVDRLWPRGLPKDKAHLDEWMKDIAPSDELRQWFGHRAERWEEFRSAYLKELENHRDRLTKIAKLARQNTVTLLFAAKNENQNNAVVVKEWLSRQA